MREKLEETRSGLTLHFTITFKREDNGQLDTVDGYVTTGVYPDGRLGEFFVTIAKEASSFGPTMDAWAKACSIALQYGAPVHVLLGKEVATRFPPAGPVSGVAGFKSCTSPTDLIARWLISKYSKEPIAAEDIPVDVVEIK